MNFSVEQINEILNDIWNFHLVLFGVALSIFTLLYSFILSKRDELKSISEQVKFGVKSPMLAQRESFAKKYILRLKSANNHIALTTLVTFILFLFGWFTQRLISDNNIQFKQISFYIISILTISIILHTIFIFIKIYNHYKSETKI
jgi:hypothetical protein